MESSTCEPRRTLSLAAAALVIMLAALFSFSQARPEAQPAPQ
jgi:hypothetical protein